MGNDASVDIAPFKRLCGTNAIQYGDKFWDTEIGPMHLDLEHDPADVEIFLRRWCESMAQNNRDSRNLNTLMEVVIGKLGDFRHQAAEAFLDDVRTTSMLNLLFLCRLFLKFMIEQHVEDLGEMFGVSGDSSRPSSASDDSHENSDAKKPAAAGATPRGSGSVSIDIPAGDKADANGSEAAPADNFGRQPSAASIVGRQAPLTIRFPRAVIDAIIALPLNSRSWEVHLELLYILITLCSTQMYQPLFEPNPFLDMLTHRLVACRADRLVQTLSKRMFDRLKSTEGVHPPLEQGCVVETTDGKTALAKVSGVLSAILLLPVRIYQYFFPSPPKEFPVADHCALALLILTHQKFVSQKAPEKSNAQTTSAVEESKSALDGLGAVSPENAQNGDGNDEEGQHDGSRRNSVDSNASEILEFVPNPFQVALEALLDQEYREHGHESESAYRISFAKLYDCIAACISYKIKDPMQKCSREWGVLVLYTYLHRNRAFKDYLFSRSDIDELLVPLLRKLYDEKDLSSNSAYMLLIVLLILSEDASFCETIFKRLPTISVPWFRESILNAISIGSLAFAVLLRTMTHNLTSNRDNYLHQNCSAILANLSPFAHKLHSYPSQRLVDVTALLAKRYLKLYAVFHSQMQANETASNAEEAEENGEKKADAPPTACNDTQSEASSACAMPVVDQSDVDTLAQFVFLLLRVVGNCLSPRGGLLASNSNLIYCVRHGAHVLVSLKSHDLPEQLWDAVVTLQHTVDFFNKAVRDARLSDSSYEAVLQVIRLSARSYETPFAHIDDDAPLRNCYDYAESDDSCEFFLPYTWRVVFETGGLAWDPRGIQLFDPEVDLFTDDEEEGSDVEEEDDHAGDSVAEQQDFDQQNPKHDDPKLDESENEAENAQATSHQQQHQAPKAHQRTEATPAHQKQHAHAQSNLQRDYGTETSVHSDVNDGSLSPHELHTTPTNQEVPVDADDQV